MLVAEITAAINSAGTLGVFYVSDDQFVTSPTDVPPNTAFIPAMMEPGSLGIHTFGDGRTGGGTRLELGEMVLANANGQYDDWINYSFDGRPITIRSGEIGMAYPTDFTTIFTGTIEGIEADWEKIVIRLRDKQYVFDRPVLTTKYAGSNVLPDGLEGTPTDIKGKVKPRVYGKVYNVPTVPVNTSKLTYQVSDGAVSTISAVYDRGAALTAGSDYATSALMQAATPAAGSFITCIAEGYVRLGSSPAGTVTADVTSKLKTNLLIYSEQLSNASGWSNVRASVSADVINSPNGTLDAEKLVCDSTSAANHYTRSVGTAVSLDTVYTASVFFKAAEHPAIRIRYYDTTTALDGCAAFFNSSTKSVVDPYKLGSGVYISSNIEDVGDGWYRASLTGKTNPTASSVRVQIEIVDYLNGSVITDPTASTGVYIWGAQLVEGVDAYTYTQTTTTAASAANTVANIISDITHVASIPTKEISTADVLNFNNINSSVVGIYVDDESSFQDCIDELLASVGGYCGFDSTGVLRMGVLTTPSGTPKVTLYEYDIHDEIERRVPKDNGIPAYRVTLNHSKIYTTQTSDIAGVVATDRRAYLEKEYRSAKAEDLTVKNQWLLATEYTQDTLLTSEADALTESSRQLDLYKVRRDIYDIPVQSEIFTMNSLKFMDVIQVMVPRFGMTNGKLFRLIGFRYELATNKIVLQVWG